MHDVRLPATDGREVLLTRCTQPEKTSNLCLISFSASCPKKLRQRAKPRHHHRIENILWYRIFPPCGNIKGSWPTNSACPRRRVKARDSQSSAILECLIGGAVNIGWPELRGRCPTSRMYCIAPYRTPSHIPLGGLASSRNQTSTRSWLSFLIQSRARAASCLRCLPHQRNKAAHCGCEHGTDGGGSKSTASTRLSKRSSNGSPEAREDCNSCSGESVDSISRSPNFIGILISLMWFLIQSSGTGLLDAQILEMVISRSSGKYDMYLKNKQGKRASSRTLLPLLFG